MNFSGQFIANSGKTKLILNCSIIRFVASPVRRSAVPKSPTYNRPRYHTPINVCGRFTRICLGLITMSGMRVNGGKSLASHPWTKRRKTWRCIRPWTPTLPAACTWAYRKWSTTVSDCWSAGPGNSSLIQNRRLSLGSGGRATRFPVSGLCAPRQCRADIRWPTRSGRTESARRTPRTARSFAPYAPCRRVYRSTTVTRLFLFFIVSRHIARTYWT